MKYIGTKGYMDCSCTGVSHGAISNSLILTSSVRTCPTALFKRLSCVGWLLKSHI